MYKDMLLKLDYHKNHIIQTFIKKGYFPTSEEVANKLECSLDEYDIIAIGGGATIFNMLYENKANLIELDLDTLYSNSVGMLQQ